MPTTSPNKDDRIERNDERLRSDAAPLAPGPASPALVSIIVCSHNGAAKLRTCLDSILRAPPPPGIGCELICVDNNSTDETPSVIEDIARGTTVPVRYLFERAQGLCCARNTGLRHAQGDLIAMTDDDCIADPGWIANICMEFLNHPTLDVLGGRVELFDKSRPPLAIRTATTRLEATPANIFGLISGNNMAFRRRVIDAVGLFDVCLNPPFLVADDLDYTYRAFAAKFETAYAPGPLIFHNHERRTDLEWKKSCIDYVKGRGGFYAKHIARGDRRVMRTAYWELRNLLKDAFRKTPFGPTTMSGMAVLGYLMRGAFSYARFTLRNVKTTKV